MALSDPAMGLWDEASCALGVPAMDTTHREFAQMAEALAGMTDDAFVPAFRALVAHTKAHFINEAKLMRACRFSAIGEHENEHLRVLGELAHMGRNLEKGRMALVREYATRGLPDWFRTHLQTMDAALAARLNTHPPEKVL